MPPNLDYDDTFDGRLTKAFLAGLDLPADTDVTVLRFEEHRNWDSLGHMSLIVSLEAEFGVQLADEVLDIDSFVAAAAAMRSMLRMEI